MNGAGCRVPEDQISLFIYRAGTMGVEKTKDKRRCRAILQLRLGGVWILKLGSIPTSAMIMGKSLNLNPLPEWR